MIYAAQSPFFSFYVAEVFFKNCVLRLGRRLMDINDLSWGAMTLIRPVWLKCNIHTQGLLLTFAWSEVGSLFEAPVQT